MGRLAAENIMIGANIPDGTEYVSGINAAPDYGKRSVSSPSLSLLPGTKAKISFVVRVCVQEGDIVNTGFLNLMIPGYTAMEQIKSDKLTNPVAANSPKYESPKPAPPVVSPALSPKSPVISPSKKSSTGSLVFTIKIRNKAEVPPFSLMVELSDDSISGQYGDVSFLNGKAKLILTQDETKTIKNLPAGITYTAQISSSLPYTFKVGEKDTAIASGTITEDTMAEVVFNAYQSSENKEKEDAVKPEKNTTVPAGTLVAGEPTLDKLYKLIFVIVVLSIIAAIQIITIISDLRVLRWYRTKKANL